MRKIDTSKISKNVSYVYILKEVYKEILKDFLKLETSCYKSNFIVM